MQIPKFELISHQLCPYVQRSIILLAEKGIAYHRTDIDLANKPAWFLLRSPTAKVPLLIVDEKNTLFESAVICEYLDEVTAASMLPADALERAKHRAWIEFGSAVLANIAVLYNAVDKTDFEHAHLAIQAKLQQLEKLLAGGPFFCGTKFQLIDAVYAPIFRYFDVFDTFSQLATFAGLEKCQSWRAALAQRPSVKQAVSIDYGQNLKQFLLNRDSYISRAVAAS